MSTGRQELLEELRPAAFSVAYRMLGSVAEAENVVRESLLRVDHALAGNERIESPRAYIVTIATRLAIDELRSARVRRERYVGEWLPEPLVVDGADDPARHAEMADSLSLAFLVLLESLSPEQRAVLLLREVGDGVSDVAVGDAVFGSGSATLAEYAVLKSWVAKPAELSFEEAAGYPVPVETAVRILDQVGLQPGETLLVSGAAGGVGSAVVQLTRRRGITVVGTAGERNQDYLRSLGAVPTTYGDGLVGRVRALAPDGVDAALDIAGSGVIPELVELTGEASKVLSIADFSAPEHGAQVSTTSTNAFAEAARLFTEGAFRIPVEKPFPLAAAADAQAASQAGHVAGRLVVTVT